MVFLSMKHVAKLKATKPEEGGRIENGESRDLISLNRFEPNLSLSFLRIFIKARRGVTSTTTPSPPREMVQSTVASSTNLVDPSIPKRSSSVFVVFDGTRAQHERRPPICFHSTPLHVLVSLMYIYIYIYIYLSTYVGVDQLERTMDGADTTTGCANWPFRKEERRGARARSCWRPRACDRMQEGKWRGGETHTYTHGSIRCTLCRGQPQTHPQF